MRRLGAIALAVLGTACAQDPAPPNPRLWTMFDVQSLYQADPTGGTLIATGAGLPSGIPIGRLVDADGNLLLGNAWADGYPAQVVTTEVWTYYDAVWLQPMYVPITGWSNGKGLPLLGPDGKSHPIFGVGPSSGFYSPFWQIIYAQVPAGTAYDALTNVRDVLDGGYPLTPGAGWMAPLVPDDVTLAATTAVGGFSPGTGWVDGVETSYLWFKSAPFAWDQDDVVQEVPLYRFLYRADDGSETVLPIPTVLGTGPPNTNTPLPTDGAGNVLLRYSPFWRFYTVILPPGAAVFAPPGTALHDQLAQSPAQALVNVDYPIANDDALGRVALNPSCFADDPDPEAGTCLYLDAQVRVESLVNAGYIEKTAITATCPVVSVKGAPPSP